MTASAAVYLDNNATTAPAPQVVAAMMECLQSDWGNPSSLHTIDPAALNAAITPATLLVTLMWANNETGALLPVAQAAALARERGALFHCDAVQAAGKVAIDLRALPIDLLSLSAHKLHGPKGVGALFVRKGLQWPPMVHGHQERGRRGGTENTAGIAGFGVAAMLAKESLHEDATRMRALRDHLERAVLAALPQVVVNAAEGERLPNTSNFRVATTEAEIILDRLDRIGVCASGGSACTAGGTEPSHVLLAMGQSRGQALAALRFSLSRYTTVAEVDRVLDVLPAIVLPVLRSAA